MLRDRRSDDPVGRRHLSEVKSGVRTARPRYVELVRVSSRGQASRDTPERQRQALDRLRDHRPGILVERIEAVASATLALDETEAGQRLAALAEARAFDELRVSEHDRVLGGRSDDLRVRLTVLSLAMRANAVIVDANSHVIDPADESGMGELDFFLRTFTSTRERKLIARRTQGGRAVKAAQGKYVGLGAFPWWLEWNKVERKVEVRADRVAIIKQAAEAIFDGRALAQVVRKLNADGIAPPRKQRWHGITLKRLLRNATLVGQRSQSLKGQTFPFEVPAVVSQEWFDRLQRTLDGARGKRRRDCYRAEALCRGRIFCGVCRELMHVQNATGGYVYYRCRSYHHQSGLTRCGNRYRPVAEIDSLVWEQLAKIILDRGVRERAAKLAGNADPTDNSREVGRLNKELKGIDDFQVLILRQRAASLISDAVSERLLREQAEKRTVLQQELSVLERRVKDSAGVRALASSLNDRMTQMAAAVPGAKFEVRRSVFETLVPAERPYGVVVGPNATEVNGVFYLSEKPGRDSSALETSEQLFGSSSGSGRSRRPPPGSRPPRSCRRRG
jgi:site-specific DNA recombinase